MARHSKTCLIPIDAQPALKSGVLGCLNQVISYAVWLYFRLPLRVRTVEAMLAARGIDVTYETMRSWPLKFEHRPQKGLNIRVENSHEPTRVREKVMRRFKSTRQLQRFVLAHDEGANLFYRCRYNVNAIQKGANRIQAE